MIRVTVVLSRVDVVNRKKTADRGSFSAEL